MTRRKYECTECEYKCKMSVDLEEFKKDIIYENKTFCSDKCLYEKHNAKWKVIQ